MIRFFFFGLVVLGQYKHQDFNFLKPFFCEEGDKIRYYNTKIIEFVQEGRSYLHCHLECPNQVFEFVLFLFHLQL